MAALAADDREELHRVNEKIHTLEGQADEIKNEIRSHLPKSLMMAFDRRDLLDLLSAQDSIADSAQDVAALLTLRKMSIPEAFGNQLPTYVQRCLDAVNQCKTAINELDELLEAGFRGRRVDRVLELLAELNLIETDADNLEAALKSQLFEYEDSMGPLDVLFWYELLRRIGDIADYAEAVGDRLRLIIAR